MPKKLNQTINNQVAFINNFTVNYLFLLSFVPIFGLLLAKIIFSPDSCSKIMAIYVLITNFIVVFLVVNQQLFTKYFVLILLFTLFNFGLLFVAKKSRHPTPK